MDLQPRTDQRARAENTEPALAAEPIENTEAREPADPIDSIEPAEPIDRIEPAEPIDRIEPLDPMLRMEPDDPAERDEPREVCIAPFCCRGRSGCYCSHRVAHARCRLTASSSVHTTMAPTVGGARREMVEPFWSGPDLEGARMKIGLHISELGIEVAHGTLIGAGSLRPLDLMAEQVIPAVAVAAVTAD